ncbi:hypothetical protein DZG00_12740 [Clavibacter lycopersici]|uniref:Uncharacterized protein n=1 Tax=Clavibacter lycopersici TaxID=2301718 RepID=A0A399SZ92_9MICO|nr:hypothetical protein [Clavibacter lycopersici]RIJ48124.1 hypothetical protein DZG00_12740 [Clavibacter lycopersici]RIJ59536.1 hypothetical protein DZG02_11680 [Clavibacter lycopersici]
MTASSPRPSRTARDRRGSMVFTGILIALVLGFSAYVALRGGTVPTWAFLGLTGAGIASGLIVYLARSRGVRWLLIAVVVGAAVALRLSPLPEAMAVWLLGVLAGSFLARPEWPWMRSEAERQRERQPRPLASIRPWSGSGLTASLTEVPIGRRGATETGVLLQAGEVTSRVRVDELHRLVTGRSGIAESVDSDDSDTSGRTVYLTRVDTSSPDSIVGEVLVGLPGDALAFLRITDPMPAGPTAVLAGADLAAFREWALTVPAP